MNSETAVALAKTKSVALGIVLTIIFGGLGVFYATIVGGIVMTLLEIIAVVITVITLGFGVIILIPVHIIALIWTIVAINNHNKKLYQAAAGS